MLSRFNRLLIVLILIAVALYIVVLNRELTTIRFGSEWVFTLNTGVLLIGAFCIGILATSLVALYFGMKAHFRERRLVALEKQRQQFLHGIIEARSYVASGEIGRSRDLWEQLAKRDPTRLIAKVELSRALESYGTPREALQLLDSVRASHPENIEALFRAAELNMTLQNKTAALDNVSLILARHPNLRAARMARQLAEDLGQIDDAIRFHKQCQELGEESATSDIQGARLRFRQIEGMTPPETKRQELLALLKRHPTLTIGLEALAREEEAAGNLGEAAQALVRAAKGSGEERYWRQAARLWLRDGKPERALAAARSAVNSTAGLMRLEGELFLAQIHLGLHQNEEASRLLQGFSALAEREGVALSEATRRTFLSLKALSLQRLGKQSELVETLQQLTNFDQPIPELTPRHIRGSAGSVPPSPTLSTP